MNPVSLAVLAGQADHVRVRLVAGRRGHGHLGAAAGGREHEAVADVVAVADVGQLEAGQGALVLAQGLEVGHGLAGVGQVGQGVDDRDPAAGGEVDGDLVAEGPDHDPVDPALEVLADVVGAFAAAHLDVGGGEVDGLAAELEHARFEGHPRAQGGLLEDHGQDLVLERLAVLVRVLLDLVGEVEHLAEFVNAQVPDRQEIFLHRGSS